MEPSKPLIVLLAGGRTKKSHLPNSRLLTPIKGTPLIVRTIKQFTQAGALVRVVTNDPDIIELVRMQKNVTIAWDADDPKYSQVDMIRKGLHFAWSRRSIIVFGDVVFTDAAVKRIMENRTEDWTVFGRSTDSQITGTRWAEYFAIELNWGSREQGKEAVNQVVSYFISGEWHRASAWEWYYHMEKMPYHIPNPANVPTGPHWVEINDGTDDIDFADDAKRLKRVHG